jgi:thiol-disulfide isomerase/thioredoxin
MESTLRFIFKEIAMSRLLLALSLAFAFTSLAAAKDDAPLGPPGATLEQVQAHPDDAKLLRRFVNPGIREISALIEEEKYDAAKQKAEEVETQLKSIKADGDAKGLHEQALEYLKDIPDEIALARLSVADVEKALLEKPDDAKALGNWMNKALGELYGIAYSRPDEAEGKLIAVKAFAAKVAEAAENDTTKTRIEGLSGRRGVFTQLETAIEKGRDYAALVGKDAAPLTVKTWVNGTPLTAGDLQGKVVLLDFWAVWCGPCINTFPHLREWQEKYGDKGLVIIGLTRYYDWNWDDGAGYATKAEDDVTDDQEQEMLKKFAAYYHLKHRFAIQEEGDSLDEYYGVSGIPHVVVLDKEGKVRMIRVGSGKQNAEDLDKLLAELLQS